METQEFIKDGGYKSRKFWLCLITMALIMVSAYVAPAAALPEVIMGILGVFTVYMGGNTVNRWNSGKLVAQAINTQLPDDSKPEPVKIVKSKKVVKSVKDEEGC